MTQFVRWIGAAALALAVRCGKKETQTVQPRTTMRAELQV